MRLAVYVTLASSEVSPCGRQILTASFGDGLLSTGNASAKQVADTLSLHNFSVGRPAWSSTQHIAGLCSLSNLSG
jgi:hypothetical protein